MTAAVARLATDHDHRLVDGYARYCQNLIDAGMMSDRARRDRLRLARQFLDQHPDLDGWMARPLPARLRDLDRVKAWPLLTYAILTRRLVVDLDLLLVKDLGDFGHATERLHADDYRAGREIAVRLGWSRRWTYDVLHECLPLLLAWTGKSMRTLLVEDLDRFEGELHASLVVSVSSRRAYQARLFGLRQLLFEARIIDTPPTRRRTAASFAERLEPIAAPEIARVMLRYLQARSAVLRPSTVSSLCDALVVFGEYLAEHHRDVTSLRQLDRGHIEGFLAANATRRWRGRLARDQQVSLTVVHAAILAVRNFLDDITAWGWAERPHRQLIFAADVPRLPRPLPRALAPGEDAQLMAAVAELKDPFARCGLTLLRGAGLRLGELLDLELGSVADYGPAGTWLKVPLGKLGTERSVPLDPDTLAALDDWATVRGQQRAHPHPRTGRVTDFLFSERGQRLGPWRIRSGLDRAVAAAGLSGADGAGPARRAAPTAAHLRHHTGQRRDEPASPDGPPRPRHRRDDPALRHPRLTDPARRLRRGDRQSPTPTPADRQRQAGAAVQGRMAPRRDAENPSGPRLLQPPPRRRSLPLRQHLRTLRQLHARTRVRTRTPRSTCRRPNSARRRRTARLDQREQPTRTSHRTPPNPPRPNQLQLRHADEQA